MSDDLDVCPVICTPAGVLAYVDDVKVRIRRRRNAPPKWWCSAHPDPVGRTSCEHIEALAQASPSPEQLAAIRGELDRKEHHG